MTLVAPSIAFSCRPGLLALLGRLAASIVRAVRAPVWWQNRRDAMMLAGADDHILADLGLTRADMRDAFSGPPWEDPTVLLRARVLERRLGRHGVSHGFPAPPQRDALRASPSERPALHDVSRPNTPRLPARP